MIFTVSELTNLDFHHKEEIIVISNASGKYLILPYEFFINKMCEIFNCKVINLANGGSLTHTES